MTGSAGRWILTPGGPEAIEEPKRRATRRRRKIFMVLLAAAALTLVMGLIPDLRWLLRLHIALDFLIVGYVLFLIQARQQRERYVPRHAPAVETEPTLEEDRFLKAGQF